MFDQIDMLCLNMTLHDIKQTNVVLIFALLDIVKYDQSSRAMSLITIFF
jgi:hypothetical protein